MSDDASPADPAPPNAEKVFAVRRAILEDEKRLLKEWPALRNQDAIGLGLFLVSFLTIVAVIRAYAAGLLPFVLVMPIVAFAASILHELEHDLIHQLYFRKAPWVQVSKVEASPGHISRPRAKSRRCL